jgi:subtilisin family serine protease
MAVTRRPAFSSAFLPDALVRINLVDALDRITPEWAWGGSSGKGVKVAVIDSGIDATHPAIGSVSGYVEIVPGPDGPVVKDGVHGDSFGHATACSSIIRGIAPECELYSVKVLSAGPGGTGPIFAAGLRWAIENGMHVCNLSLGTTKRDYYALFHELADQAYFNNVMLVTAANNMPSPSFPSLYASVISVASHDIDDPYCFYYNPRPPVEFGAHGINVRVAWPGNKWMVSTGNSYACPHITGIIAKILGKHPGLTVFHAKTILAALATNVRGNTKGNGSVTLSAEHAQAERTQ